MAVTIAEASLDLSILDSALKDPFIVNAHEINDSSSSAASGATTPLTPPIDTKDATGVTTKTCSTNITLDRGSVGHIIDVFQDIVAGYPLKTALTSHRGTIDYATFNTRANQLARYLISIGVKPGNVVALRIPRCVDGLVAMIAVWKAGGVYLPLDCSLPEERVKTIVEDSGVRFVLTYDSLSVAKPCRYLPQIAVLMDSLETISLIEKLSPSNLPSMSASTDLAYIIYTSGSTGVPKGVTTTHDSLLHMVEDMLVSGEIVHSDRVILFSPLCFDASIREIGGSLAAGATLYLPGLDEILPGNLVEVLLRQRITHICLTPSVLRNCQLVDLPDLRGICVAGEASDMALMAKWGKTRTIINAYGPTEAAVASTKKTYLPGEIKDDSEPVSIGYPTLNTKIYILDPSGSLTPAEPGEIGEIYIGGPGVSRHGYLNRPELNSRVFLENPFHPGLMFKSGDLGRFLPNGEIQCFGRVDHQVKLNGQRIEVEDIESSLRSDERVSDALVDLRGPLEQRHLAAYIIRSEIGLSWDSTKLSSSLKSYLRDRIPVYSIPSTFTFVDAWPTNASNKVVKALLPDPLAQSRPETLEHPEVQCPIEMKVAEIFCETLNLSKDSVLDSSTTYFDLGGTSLTAQLLLNSLNQCFDSNLRVAAFYACGNSIQSVAGLIKAKDFRAELSYGRDFSDMVELPHDIIPIKSNPNDRAASEPKSVLLTGASGFLGSHLLARILESSKDKVFCLIRAKDRETAFKRLQACLKSWGLWQDFYTERLQAVPGNVSKPFLGMDPMDFASLARECEVVWHCAAAVNFVAPYATLEPTNVTGTVEVLRFASTFVQKAVKYVSTLATLAGVDASIETCLEESTRCWSKHLNSGYAQSKWVAEQLATEYQARGGDVVILRPGRILGSTHQLKSPEEDTTVRVLQSFAQTGVAPDIVWAFGFLPVDAVARLCVQIADHADNGIFHIRNPKKLTIKQLLDIMSDCGMPIRMVPYSDWIEQLPKCRYLEPLLSLFKDPMGPNGESSFELLSQGQCFEHDTFSIENSRNLVKDEKYWDVPDYSKLLRSYFQHGLWP